MTPVVKQMYKDAGSIAGTKDMVSEANVKSVFDAVGRGKEPLRRFLIKHAHNEDRLLFAELARRLDESCAVDVKEAQSGDLLIAGRALICPG